MFRTENAGRGVNNEDLLVFNRATVLQYLKRNGVCSRAELAKETGLTQASISKIISSLIDCDVVREVGSISGELGRRSKGIVLNAGKYKVVGVKISRRSFSVGIFDIGGNNYGAYTEPIEPGTPVVESIAKIRMAIEIRTDNTPDIMAIGVAVPGPYLKKEGRIAMMSETSGWENISLYDAFSNIQDLPIFIEHDANSAAIAEWWFGKQKCGEGVMVYLLADEGIGAGVVVDGRVFTGSQGIAGEIGHISLDVHGTRCPCGNYGCLETFCSAIAFVRDTKALLAEHPRSILNRHYRLTADDIFDAAREGDELAVSMVQRVGRYLGYGVVTLINAYDPSTIVIGNVMSHGGKMLLEEIKAVTKERVLPDVYENLNIRLSDFRIDPILYGAAALATDRFLNNPSKFLP